MTTESSSTRLPFPTFSVSLLILAFLILLRLLPFLLPDSRLWAFNHSALLSFPAQISLLILAAAALILPLLPQSSRWGEFLAARFSYLFFESPRKIFFRLALIAMAIILFFLFRSSAHFLGDGYAVLDNLASDKGTFVKWSERGITWILKGVQSLYGGNNHTTALAAARTVSVLSGTIALWFYFLIAEIAAADKFRRTLIFLSLTFSGSLLLFFGYVENYPMLWIALPGFTYFSLRFLRGKAGLLAATFFLALGIFIHLQMIIFFPALLYLLFARGLGQKLYRRYRTAFVTLGIFIAIGAVVFFIHRYRSDLYFENIFLPLLNGKTIAPDYLLFSAPHLLDIFNQLLFLSPLLPLWLYWAFPGSKTRPVKRSSAFFALAAAGAILFLLVIDPTLGMVRDWDLFSLSTFGLTLLALTLIPDRVTAAGLRLLPTCLILLPLFAVPPLAVHLNEKKSEQYALYMHRLDGEKSISTLIALRRHYRDRGDLPRAEEVNVLFKKYDYNTTRLDRTFNLLDRGEYPRARELFRTIVPDRLSSRYHGLLSAFSFLDKNYTVALAESDSALRLQAYNPELYYTRSVIFADMRRNDSSLFYLRKGLRLNRKHAGILKALALIHYSHTRRPDSTLYYARQALILDSLDIDAVYFMALGHADLGDLAEAQKYGRKYLQMGYADPFWERRSKSLLKIFPEGIAP